MCSFSHRIGKPLTHGGDAPTSTGREGGSRLEPP
jgi:hypothetical protein